LKNLPPLMPLDEARDKLLASLPRLCGTETLPTDQCAGRILAEDVVAPINVPPAPNSSMDGYAVRFADLDGSELPVSQRIPAGHMAQPLQRGTAARIFTGAEMPPGADTIVIQEDAQVTESGAIRVTDMPKPGEWVRPAGMDLKQGETILTAGTRITPPAVGVSASMGLTHLKVYKPLKVALITTGDELVEPGQPLAPGKIYNSNIQMIGTLLEQAGFEWVRIPRVEDDREATVAALKEGVAQADAVLTIGGVSVGEEDHVKAAIESLGTLNLWRIRLKPGKPFAAAEIEGTPIFSLPGNPMSSLVTFSLLARPCLMHLQGAVYKAPLSIPVEVGFSREEQKRDEYVRVALIDGVAKTLVSQNSGVLSSALTADGLLHLPAFEPIEVGKSYAFTPFSALLNT